MREIYVYNMFEVPEVVADPGWYLNKDGFRIVRRKKGEDIVRGSSVIPANINIPHSSTYASIFH